MSETETRPLAAFTARRLGWTCTWSLHSERVDVELAGPLAASRRDQVMLARLVPEVLSGAVLDTHLKGILMGSAVGLMIVNILTRPSAVWPGGVHLAMTIVSVLLFVAAFTVPRQLRTASFESLAGTVPLVVLETHRRDGDFDAFVARLTAQIALVAPTDEGTAPDSRVHDDFRSPSRSHPTRT